MKVTFELGLSDIEKLVIGELKAYHELCRQCNKIDNSDEVIPPDTVILDAIETVLYDYMTKEEYDAWFKEAYGTETK